MQIHSFTKHGNGERKLGRRHYAPYEPRKYQAWSNELKIPFLFGNGIAKFESAFAGRKNFYPDMFWLEPGRQGPTYRTVEQALHVAERDHLIVLVHPENVQAIKKVGDDFQSLIRQAKDRKIPFVVELN